MCYYICCWVTLNILTTVKSFDKLLRKVKICLQIGLLKIKKYKNLKRYNRCVCAVCAQWARRVRAVNTLQQVLARCKNVMDTVITLWERRVDAVGMLWGRCVHALTDKFDILGVFRGDPTAC